MIIWQGRGVIVLVVPFVILLGLQLAVYQLGQRSDWQDHLGTFVAVAFGASAIILWWFARHWKEPGRILVDRDSGEEVVLRRADTFFFVPLRIWPPIYGSIAIVAVVYGILNGRI